jgi:hypothetical protein
VIDENKYQWVYPKAALLPEWNMYPTPILPFYPKVSQKSSRASQSLIMLFRNETNVSRTVAAEKKKAVVMKKVAK